MCVSAVGVLAHQSISAKSLRRKTACSDEFVGINSVFIFFVSVQVSFYMGVAVSEFDGYLQLFQR